MLAVSAIGLDIAKSVFQVHGIDAEGKGVCTEYFVRWHIASLGARRARARVSEETSVVLWTYRRRTPQRPCGQFQDH
jgi:hypothetical protein